MILTDVNGTVYHSNWKQTSSYRSFKNTEQSYAMAVCEDCWSRATSPLRLDIPHPRPQVLDGRILSPHLCQCHDLEYSATAPREDLDSKCHRYGNDWRRCRSRSDRFYAGVPCLLHVRHCLALGIPRPYPLGFLTNDVQPWQSIRQLAQWVQALHQFHRQSHRS